MARRSCASKTFVPQNIPDQSGPPRGCEGGGHLSYNNDVTKAANLILQLDVGGTNFQLFNAVDLVNPLLSGSLATVLSLTVNGNTDNVAEQLTINDVNGLPTFSSTPTSLPNRYQEVSTTMTR